MNPKMKHLQSRLAKHAEKLIDLEKDTKCPRDEFLAQLEKVNELRCLLEQEQLKELLAAPDWRTKLRTAMEKLIDPVALKNYEAQLERERDELIKEQ